MFSTSTQLDHWMYGSVDEVSRLRQEANLAFIAKHQKLRNIRDTDVSRFFLNHEEEKMLLMFYQNVLRDFCKSFQPPMPRSVIVS
jgi:cyclin H